MRAYGRVLAGEEEKLESVAEEESVRFDVSDTIGCRIEEARDDPKKLTALVLELDAAIQQMELAHADANRTDKSSNAQNAARRIGALLITLGIELVVAFVVSEYTDTLEEFCLLIAFQPVISAISGNIGLQSSATNIQGLSAGVRNYRSCWKGIIKDVATGLYLSLAMGILLGGIACGWSISKNRNTEAGLVFGAVIGFGQFAAGIAAAFTGALAPHLFKRLGVNPTDLAGPFETAFQDVVGTSVLLMFSGAVLKTYGQPQNC